MNEQIENLIIKLLEGIKIIREQKNFERLIYKGELIELEDKIKKIEKINILEIKDILNIYKMAHTELEGMPLSGSTVWNTSISIVDKEMTLEEIITELDTLLNEVLMKED